jgi:cysteinyl-tRNA synthetase
MLIVEERALVTDLQDKMIERLVERQEAWARGNAPLVRELTRQIDRLRSECADIRQSAAEQLPRRRS